jgi:hypothetical protein
MIWCIFGHAPDEIKIRSIDIPFGAFRHMCTTTIYAEAVCWRCGVLYRYSERVTGQLAEMWMADAHNKLTPKPAPEKEL